mmetsp:Transcript_10828/g.25339  ORF Transcript_10828/g.25339 Transcript_10828/m.25339 type:complete len:216 (+) Transcript_10828:26-673(+)
MEDGLGVGQGPAGRAEQGVQGDVVIAAREALSGLGLHPDPLAPPHRRHQLDALLGELVAALHLEEVSLGEALLEGGDDALADLLLARHPVRPEHVLDDGGHGGAGPVAQLVDRLLHHHLVRRVARPSDRRRRRRWVRRGGRGQRPSPLFLGGGPRGALLARADGRQLGLEFLGRVAVSLVGGGVGLPRLLGLLLGRPLGVLPRRRRRLDRCRRLL